MKHENLHLEMKQGYFASYCKMKLKLSKNVPTNKVLLGSYLYSFA